MLKQEICDGAFEPGQKLQEVELAKRYNVSRSPIREALHQLSADGLVEEIPNKGVFVKKFTVRDIEEIYDVRVMLESYAIDRLPRVLTTEGADSLLKLLHDMEQSFTSRDLTAYIQQDTLLHSQLVHLCGNTIVEELYEKVCGRVQQFRRYSLTSTQRFDESIGEHRSLIENVVSNRSVAAKDINCRHLELAKGKVVEYLLQLETAKKK
jgi:DNA-binding GntR family transcriptional regulator